jgi:L-iditol 2-dehydrogenase
MAAALAQLHGAASVRVYEANPARVERARALGFDAGQPNESKADTTDVMFECAGAARAVAYSIKIARRGGRVVLVGVAAPETEVSFRPFEVFRRELTIIGAFTNP